MLIFVLDDEAYLLTTEARVIGAPADVRRRRNPPADRESLCPGTAKTSVRAWAEVF